MHCVLTLHVSSLGNTVRHLVNNNLAVVLTIIHGIWSTSNTFHQKQTLLLDSTILS